MRLLKSEVFRLFTIGFAAGALVVAAPIGAKLARLMVPAAHAVTSR